MYLINWLHMNKALVFGGNGFLGSFVVKELCEKNFEVLVISHTDKNFEELKTFGFPGQIAFKKVDVTDVDLFSVLNFKPFDIIINLIGIGSERGKNSYHGIHIEFASRLASVALRGDKTFIHVSAFTGNEPSQSKYINTKRAGEEAILRNNPKTIILRPSVMIGEGGSFIQTFETMINNLPFIPIAFGSNIKIQPVFAGDVAKFIVLALNKTDMEGKSFNLAGEEVVLFKDFIKRICGFMNKKRGFLPVPFSLIFLGLKMKEFLPSFIFRTKLTSDIFALSKMEMLVKKNDIKLLIPNPKKIDEVLEEVLSKYKLYD